MADDKSPESLKEGDFDEGVASLHNQKSTAWTACMLAGFLVNIALLLVSHIGINAYVYSTQSLISDDTSSSTPVADGQCNDQDKGIWNGTLILNTTSRCTIWDQMSTNPGTVLHGRACPYINENAAVNASNDFQFAYGLCAGLDNGPCSQFGTILGTDEEQMFQLMSSEWGFSRNCSNCFMAVTSCSASQCSGQCTSQLTNKGCPNESGDVTCAECVATKCTPEFKKCTGLKFLDHYTKYVYHNCPAERWGDSSGAGSTSAPQALEGECYATSDSCLDTENDGACKDTDKPFTFFNVFTIKFANAVTKAWQGGAKFLSVLVLLASGVWPYVKNIVMMVCWFKPMTAATRERLIVFLARFGRWSLVDVFAVILIIVGLRVDKQLGLTDDYLILRSQSDYAIYCFAIAALWALGQGEVIGYLNRQTQKSDPTRYDNVKTLQQTSPVRGAFFFFCLLALGLTIVGLTLVNLQFEMKGIMEGWPGPSLFKYTGFQVGTALIDSCQFKYIGETFLLGIFFLTVVVFPVLALLGYLALAVKPDYMMQRRGLVRVVNICGNFACVDVYILSTLVLIAQFEPLIAGSLEEAEVCGAGVAVEDCVRFIGTLEIGAVILGVASVCYWICQFMAVYVQNHFRQQLSSSSKVAAPLEA